MILAAVRYSNQHVALRKSKIICARAYKEVDFVLVDETFVT